MIIFKDFLNVVSDADIISVYYNGNKVAYGNSDQIINECENYLDYKVKYFASEPTKVNALIVIL